MLHNEIIKKKNIQSKVKLKKRSKYFMKSTMKANVSCVNAKSSVL